MNLYFRLILLLLSLPFIKKVSVHNQHDQHDQKDAQNSLSHKSELPFRVLPNDLDAFNHMNNSRYLSIMDFGRFHLMAQFGSLKKAYQKGWAPAVGGIKINYIRALKLFNHYKLTTQIIYWDEKWVYLEQQFITLKDNQLMATALVKALFTSKQGKVSSDELLTTFFPEGLSKPPLPEKIRRWRESELKS